MEAGLMALKGKAVLSGEGGRSRSAVLTDKAGCSGGSALGRRAAVMPGVRLSALCAVGWSAGHGKAASTTLCAQAC